MRAIFSQISPKSILLQATEDKDYMPKRKALSAAFFKKKLSLIIEIVKQVTIGYLSETKQKTEIDLYQFTTELMGRIIVNIAVGKGQAATLIDYEKKMAQSSNSPFPLLSVDLLMTL